MNKLSVIVLNISLLLSVAVAGLFAYMFFWHHRYVQTDMPLATDVVGQYGDFIGGVLGTILSVVLLYYTLHIQRADSNNNAKVYEKQQLSTEFYQLLALYENILKGFTLHTDDIDFRGKELVDACVVNLRDGFDTNEKPIRKNALRAYMTFYAQNGHFAPIYFRTLYRICETVCSKEAQTDYKNVEFIKILRAQLTASEMVLMRYNAQTIMGTNFKYYINKFNLLKHLPPLDLLEYKQWRKVLMKGSEGDVSTMSAILIELRQRMAELLHSNGASTLDTFTEYKSLVTFAIRTSDRRDELTIIVNRRQSQVIPTGDSFGCVMRLSKEELTDLLSYFLYDSIVQQNFNEYNERRHLEFFHNDKSPSDGSRDVIELTVKNNRGKRIIMKWEEESEG